MPYELVEKPIPGPAAFKETSDAAVLSQTALLLLLGARLRGDAESLRASAAALGLEDFLVAVPEEDLKEFPVPDVKPPTERIPRSEVRASLARQYERTFMEEIRPEEWSGADVDILVDLAKRVYEEPTPLTVAQLLEGNLRNPQEIVRVAAAATYQDLVSEPSGLFRFLERGTTSKDDLVRDVAATALANIDPENPHLAELTKVEPPGPGSEPPRTTLLVHGTWAHRGHWWRPGENFHSYLGQGIFPDLYGATDYFQWSGSYTDAGRAVGALDLLAWVHDHGTNGLNLVTHSHGGSVAMLATRGALEVGELILLSCPVHVPKYLPDFRRVQKKVVSIRVKLDLVIMADRGGQKFRHPQICENVLPIYFNHSATHDPNVWRKFGVPSMIRNCPAIK